MSLVFENALMPSENQQALRLRLAYIMPSLKLPQNKFTLLAINIAFIFIWVLFRVHIGRFILDQALGLPTLWYAAIYYCRWIVVFIPPVLLTIIIWQGPPKLFTHIFLNKRIWGRLKPKPRITRSKDD